MTCLYYTRISAHSTTFYQIFNMLLPLSTIFIAYLTRVSVAYAGHAMTSVVGHCGGSGSNPNLVGVCCRQSSTGTGFFRSASVFVSHCYSFSASDSSIRLASTLCNLSN